MVEGMEAGAPMLRTAYDCACTTFCFGTSTSRPVTCLSIPLTGSKTLCTPCDGLFSAVFAASAWPGEAGTPS
eukprot:CAMPEP_0195060686 /NCGR_PEP_ID=MMETSP0448-20130528/7882_1 /TAXON_ID=66468 /ORGANISM="Heterocapsa triquestra, Strain CCMP 448" /LENGTH=71 /DNA_ID=CAMNT_0040091137 /DNA_START=42 /DNA_END=254 /DNA_ORIENTATION=-